MECRSQSNRKYPDLLLRSVLNFPEWISKMVEASFNRAEAMQICSKGIVQSFCEFMAPSAGAMNCISEVERKKALLALPQDTYRDYLDLLRFNIEIGAKGLINSLTAVTDY